MKSRLAVIRFLMTHARRDHSFDSTNTDEMQKDIFMIVTITQTNIFQAAEIHSISWQDSHRSFCSPEFVNLHTPEHQKEYLAKKMENGSHFYMLIEGTPVGIVSVTGSLIEDLYVLPEKQGLGYGTQLLLFAIEKCTDTPTLWILENNKKAERLYLRMGFRKTGRINEITAGINEIEFALDSGLR